MRVTFYGVRGSTPAPGPDTARYGGNTSCVEVRLADDSLLVLDAGTGMRKLGGALSSNGGLTSPVHLLLSHTHWDHVLGLPFFAPLWKKTTTLKVFPLASEAQERFQRTIFDDIHFPVSANDVPATIEFVKPEADTWRIGTGQHPSHPAQSSRRRAGFPDRRRRRRLARLLDRQRAFAARGRRRSRSNPSRVSPTAWSF